MSSKSLPTTTRVVAVVERPRRGPSRFRGRFTGRFVARQLMGTALTLLFVIVVNFFLFRVINPHPERTLARKGEHRRGARGHPAAARTGPAAVGAVLAVRAAGVHGRSGHLVPVLQARGRNDRRADGADPAVGAPRHDPLDLGRHVARQQTGLEARTRLRPFHVERRDHRVLDTGVVDRPAAVHGVRGQPGAGHLPDRRAAHPGHRPWSIVGIADTIWHLVLPTITLTIAYIAEYSIIMRSSMLDVVGQDYLMTGRAKGLTDRQLLRRHALPTPGFR